MKICAHCHRLDRTGAPIILNRLLRELAKRHTVEMLLPQHKSIGTLVAEYEKVGIPMRNDVRIADYDVFLCNTMVSSRLVTRLQDAPTLYWVHEPRGGLRFFEENKSDPKAFDMATRVVFPTLWQAQEVFAPYLTRDNWRVVPYGIGTDETPQPAPFTRRPGALYLMHTGMLCGRKGQDVSISALGLLPELDIEIFLVGDDKFDPEFTRKLRDLFVGRPDLARRVHFTGSLNELQVNAYIQACDALVFPTRDDLITLAILEGLLFKKCILSSDFGPIPETIRHLDTGLLSPVGDPYVLAENIRLIYHDRTRMQRLAQAGREIYDRKHSFQGHVSAMERMLEETIAIKRKGTP